MCLTICATFAFQLVIFISEESLFVDAIKLSVVQTAVFHLYIIWYCDETRGVTRLDGARGKKQYAGVPMLEPEFFRKQMYIVLKQIYCVEVYKSTCDIVGTFRRPPQWFGSRGIVPPLPPRYVHERNNYYINCFAESRSGIWI